MGYPEFLTCLLRKFYSEASSSAVRRRVFRVCPLISSRARICRLLILAGPLLNMAASAVWQQFTAEFCGPLDKWQAAGISSLYADANEFHLDYRGYRLTLNLEESDILACVGSQTSGSEGLLKPRKFRITGTPANPVIFDGQREWSFLEMLHDLITWLRKTADDHARS